MILEDQEVAGKRAIDYILPKLEDDPALRGAMEVARTRHPSESILFNIDIIAPNQGRTERESPCRLHQGIQPPLRLL